MKYFIGLLSVALLVGWFVWAGLGSFHRAQAQKHYYNQRLAEAHSEVDRSFGLGRDNVSSHMLKAEILQEQNRFQESIEQIDLALNLATDNADRLAALNLQGYAQARLERWEEGRATYSLALQLHDNSDYRERRAYCYGQLGHWEKALADYQKILERSPDHARALEGKIHAARELSMFQEALSGSEALAKLLPSDPGTINGLAWDQAVMGQYDKAEVNAKKALELRPDSGHTLDTLGYIYVGQGRHEEAVDVYTRVLKIVPDSAHSYLGRSEAFKKLGMTNEAASDKARATELDPDVKLRWL